MTLFNYDVIVNRKKLKSCSCLDDGPDKSEILRLDRALGGCVVPARRDPRGGGHDDRLVAHRLVLAEAHRHPTVGGG